MCYAIPGRVVDIQSNLAVIDYFGERKKARNDFLKLAVNDYVYAQGGFVIQKVSKEEAMLSLDAWKELFFQLKNIDDRLGRFNKKAEGVDPGIRQVLNRAQSGAKITEEEALKLLRLEGDAEKELLCKTANSVRQKLLSNACCVHGIIEFSNFCGRDCLYCGIRKSNEKVTRYRMTPQEILESVKEAVDLGFKALVLQSGEDAHYSDVILEDLIKTIRRNFPALIFLSAGERTTDFYDRMFEAGVRGVLFRFETSNKALYEKMRPDTDYQNRICHLEYFGKKGFLIATGGLLGLPGQVKEDFVKDIFLARSLGTEMYSFGPFIPHPDTPLSDARIISKDDVLKFIAVTRLIVPDAKILVTTALETIGKETRREALLSGANSFMLNVTPLKYRRLYEIYLNRACVDKPLRGQVDEALALLKELGRAPTDLGL